jgi:rRNA-processing protein FCF1
VVDCSVSAAWIFEEQSDAYTESALARGLPMATRDKALARAAVDSGIGVWAPENSTTSPALRP